MKNIGLAVLALSSVVMLSGCSSAPEPQSAQSIADSSYLGIVNETIPDLNGTDAEKIEAGKRFCALIDTSGSVESALTQYGNSIFQATSDKEKAGRALSAISGGAVLSYCPEYMDELTLLISE